MFSVQKFSLNFSSSLRDTPDIYRFPIVDRVKIHFLLGNLLISGASLGRLEKFKHSFVLLNIKYNCAIVFLCQMYLSFLYASKHIISPTTIVKPFLKCRNYWTSSRVSNRSSLSFELSFTQSSNFGCAAKW